MEWYHQRGDVIGTAMREVAGRTDAIERSLQNRLIVGPSHSVVTTIGVASG